MGSMYQSGKTGIFGSVPATIAGGLPTGASQVNATAQGVNTGATIYTVTAGKVLYVTHLRFAGTTANVAWVNVAGTQKIIGWNVVNGEAVASGGFILRATAGQAITLTHASGAGNGYATLIGYEVDA